MSRGLKRLVKTWLPPIMLKRLRRVRRWGIVFEGGFRSWDEARAASAGYDHTSILHKVRDATLKVKRGEAVYERDSVTFDRIEYSFPVLAGLLWAAAADGGRLSVLDFGGSLGSSYFQNRRFLGALRDVRWGVVEQPHYVDTGRELIAEGPLAFFDTVDACVAANRPNVVLLSSVLQYVESYGDVLDALVASRPAAIIIDRTIVNEQQRDGVFVQHVPPAIYSATYPCYSLSEPNLLGYFTDAGYELQADFDCPEFPPLEAIGSLFKGYIFARRSAS